jgi:hypothetical protein
LPVLIAQKKAFILVQYFWEIFLKKLLTNFSFHVIMKWGVAAKSHSFGVSGG